MLVDKDRFFLRKRANLILACQRPNVRHVENLVYKLIERGGKPGEPYIYGAPAFKLREISSGCVVQQLKQRSIIGFQLFFAVHLQLSLLLP